MTKLIAVHMLILASAVRGALDEIAPGKAFFARDEELSLVARGAARKPTAGERDMLVVKRAGPQPSIENHADEDSDARLNDFSDNADTEGDLDAAAGGSADETEATALTDLTVAQLMAMAADEGVDLAGAKKKADIIEIIQAHFAVPATAEDDMI